MNKQAFLEELSRLTASLAEEERARLNEYYGELIDDGIEDGASEEQAVAALGDPADIARSFANAGERSVPRGVAETVTALNRLSIRVHDADVHILREPLDNGAAAQVRFSDPARFQWRAEGDALEIVESKAGANARFSFRALRQSLTFGGQRVTVALAQDLPGDLEFNSNGGNLTLEGVALGGAVRLHSLSGDFRLRQVACAGALELVSASGDLKLDGVQADALTIRSASGDISADSPAVDGALWAETTSGDVTLRRVRCGELTVASTSGDVEIDRGEAGAASVRTTSGDVRLDELATDPTLAVQASSGDIELHRCIARQTRLNTASGDVTLRLEPLPCGYDIAADTRSGDIRLPHGNPSTGDPQPQISVNTLSGDIDARILD